MKQYLAILTTIVVIIGLLLVLNAASFVERNDAAADSEFQPDRSSYNMGATGTRAFYEFLQGSGYKIERWRQPLSALLGEQGAARPQILIVVGATQIPFDEKDVSSLMRWVQAGGRLVFVDRNPPLAKLPSLARWTITARTLQEPVFNFKPDATEEPVAGVEKIAPQQPTMLTRGVDDALPSRYAARLTLASKTSEKNSDDAPPSDGEQNINADDEDEDVSPAPLIHLADREGALLVDYSYGAGRIVLLSDPFLIANNGIERADNLRLAKNLVGWSKESLIAFDEYHHGHGATNYSLLTYFSGTPIPALVAQFILLTLILLWAHAQRFARSLPAPHVDRRSKLEFITSMAELQMRARAYDLALENIYARVRRVLARSSGADANASRERLSARVAAHYGDVRREELEELLRACEDTIAGEATSANDTLALAQRLRALERRLGLQQRRRASKQAAEKID